MKTQNLELTETEASTLNALQKELRTQNEAFTRTPLFCVYEQENEDSSQDGAGWPVSMFLTEKAAEQFIKYVHYRLRNPYVYVRSPGEDSDLHDLHLLLKEAAGLGNGPYVEEETTLYPS